LKRVQLVFVTLLAIDDTLLDVIALLLTIQQSVSITKNNFSDRKNEK
jgi:hypothetical protein